VGVAAGGALGPGIDLRDALRSHEAVEVCPAAIRIDDDLPLDLVEGAVDLVVVDLELGLGGGLHDLAIAGGNPPTVFAATDQGVFDIRVATDPTVLVLLDGRFRVQVAWRDFQQATGDGKVAVAGGDSGLFYFFAPDNWELLMKVLDGCKLNGRYWVFGAATTNVEYTLRVTDTATGTVKTYRNPLGVASPSITDTQAFATCAAR